MPDDGLDHVDGRAPYSADSGLAASIFVITSSFSVAVITAPSNQAAAQRGRPENRYVSYDVSISAHCIMHPRRAVVICEVYLSPA